MRHHTIVVASWDDEAICKAQQKAVSIFPWVSPVSPPAVNGYRSFFIPPDGSKEWWDESDKGNERRTQYVEYLNTVKYGDGSSSLRWFEAQFGDDEYQTKITRDSDEGMRE